MALFLRSQSIRETAKLVQRENFPLYYLPYQNIKYHTA